MLFCPIKINLLKTKSLLINYFGDNMNKDELYILLKANNVFKANNEFIKNLEPEMELLKSVSTGIAGDIKIYNQSDNENLVIEQDQKNNYYIRLMKSKHIEEFINERLSIYDKMWDGCGCKVFYEEQWEPINEKELTL